MMSNEFNNGNIFRTVLIIITFLMVQVIVMMNLLNVSVRTMEPMKYLPLVLVTSGGCSGSYTVGKYIGKIVDAHGLETYDEVNFHFMNNKKEQIRYEQNRFYHELVNRTEYANSTHEEVLLDSFEIAKKEAEGQGQVFYFKAQVKYIGGEFRERMDEIGATFVGLYRDNVLDRCICVTKECFPNAAGYPVFAVNGTRTDLCASNSKVDVPTLVHIENPKPCFQRSSDDKQKIQRQKFPSVSEESLFEFEYTESDEAFQRSTHAWMKLLRLFLSADLDKSIVKKVLEETRGSRPPPSPHKDLVSNYDYLVKEIHGTQWEHYLRNM